MLKIRFFVLTAGLLCSTMLPGAAMAGPAELVVNGGFELNGGLNTSNFTSWTTLNTNDVYVYYDESPEPGASYVRSGNYSALWNDSTWSGLSQELTTVAGQSYVVDFWASTGGGFAGDGSFFKVEFGNNVLVDLDASDLGSLFDGNWSPNYQHFTFNVTGTGSDTLKFSFYAAEAEGALDDVSVSAVPVPGAIWLLGSGLIGLFGLSRKKKSAVAVA